MNNTHISRIIDKHRGKAVVLDANLLIVLCTGDFNPSYVGTRNRTDNYSPKEYLLLKEIINQFKHIITLPNILTEVTNLITLKGKKQTEFSIFLKEYIKSSTEIYLESKSCSNASCFERLGLSDAGIFLLSSQGNLVISSDLDLCLAIEGLGNDVINFNHIRCMAW